MDTVVRALVVLALLSLSAFRLIRYFRYGMARRVAIGAPSTWGSMSAPESLAPPNSRASRILAGAVSLLVFVVANSILCLVLFAPPIMGRIPLPMRLFVVIFANFYLVPFAQAMGAKQLERLRARASESANPLGG